MASQGYQRCFEKGKSQLGSENPYHISILLTFSPGLQVSESVYKSLTLHSLDIPPDVKNTRGVKFPFSTLSTLSLYSFFFSSSFSLYICWKGLDLFDKQFGCVTLTSKKDLSNEVHTPLADISNCAWSVLCVEGRSHRH